MSRHQSAPEPVVEVGIEYWKQQPATYDGVLGGFGAGSLPRVDALGSRQFLMYLMPEFCTVESSARPLQNPEVKTLRSRIRALDVGAGVGRVTSDVLLHLVHDVVLVEPVEIFIQEALKRGVESSEETTDNTKSATKPWKGIRDKKTSVTFIQGTLQALDPALPFNSTTLLGRVGFSPSTDDGNSLFDVIWCQWCLGHLSDPDLIAFFKRCKNALRDPTNSLIVVKENLCHNANDGGPLTEFDESDSSLTRSDSAWKKAFAAAGLILHHEQVQLGFPRGLFDVKMYALRGE